MLELKEISKQYGTGETAVTALDKVSVAFRESEFVAVLGHSGCGKTTMLNIIGGLDQYTTGDLVINGRSTKEYKDKDWDAYRNHSIGFIFQSYNLISHQNVLANVELALTVSGVSKDERRRRAVEALEKVGLGDQLNKRPNQMSGGQMQRVAIARALVNDPDILLADEPTGALDSENSIQVMELLKEIAKDRLVIMVTHNPELAETYATRIVRIKDGRITDDSKPFVPENSEKKEDTKKHVSMSFFTAVALSFNNLLTKKGRTFLTAFAGSIGIIGIALILSLSTGINNYINQIQEETLSSYPITINKETTDTSELLASVISDVERDERAASRSIYSNTDSLEIFNSYNSNATKRNNLADFKEFLENDKRVQENISAIKYHYPTGMQLYTTDSEGKIIKCDISEVYLQAWGIGGASSSLSLMQNTMMSMGDMQIWTELISDENGGISDLEKNHYELVYGDWPKASDEMVLIVSQNNEISDLVLYALGFKDTSKAAETLGKVVKGEVVEDYGRTEWTFEEAAGHTYKAILPYEFYTKGADGGLVNISDTEEGLDLLYNSDNIGKELKISGIIRPTGDSNNYMSMSFLGVTSKLTDELLEKTENSELIKQQENDHTTEIVTGLPFLTDDYTEPTDEEKAQRMTDYLSEADSAVRAEIFTYLSSLTEDTSENSAVPADMSREDMEAAVIASYTESAGIDTETIADYVAQMDDETLKQYVSDIMSGGESSEGSFEGMDEDEISSMFEAEDFTTEQLALAFNEFTPEQFSDTTYEKALENLGLTDRSEPDTISIYAMTFEKKDRIADIITEYNDSHGEEDQIRYTDYVALLMSSITDIISGISYLLIAFVGISLVVSSIMIGIITYISVLERTREIGILRAIGASKRDISNVFNAETLIVGFTAGLFGIITSIIAIFPINALLLKYTKIEELKAVLPWKAAIILIIISMVLTLIAGLIPSGLAAKKDPVEALRTE